MSREAREEPKPYPPYPLGPPEKPAGGVRDVRLGCGCGACWTAFLRLLWAWCCGCAWCLGVHGAWCGRPPLAGLPPACRLHAYPSTAMAQRVFAYRGAGGRVVVDLPPLRSHAPGVCVFKSPVQIAKLFGENEAGPTGRRAGRAWAGNMLVLLIIPAASAARRCALLASNFTRAL